LFSWWCSLTKYYIFCVFVRLSRNSFHDGDSRKIATSHEIYLWRWTLTKYQTLTKSIREVNSHEIPKTLTKSIREGELLRNTTKNRHENTDTNLMVTLFSWGWPLWTPAMKRISGGELSWNVIFVSIILSFDGWRCTLTHYFRESKTIFRDMFCILTKYPLSGSVLMEPTHLYSNLQYI
jgi:hypothetical protein